MSFFLQLLLCVYDMDKHQAVYNTYAVVCWPLPSNGCYLFVCLEVVA
jgi:hypothetical protein